MKIGFFITARLKSTRLKEKILLDLNGKTVVDRVIERAKSVKGIDGVVLCTSTHPQDAVLKENALKNNIDFFTGSEDDVLDRLLGAAKQFGYDAFVSITADNPLFSIYTSSVLVEMYKKEQHDFINTKGLPIGCGTYIIDTKALEVVNFMKQQSDTEIWGPFINRPDFFNVAELIVENSLFDEKLRITLDYPEDYQFFIEIYKNFEINSTPSLNEVFDLFNKNSEILSINSGKIQLGVPEEIMTKINENFEAHKRKAIEFSININKKIISNHFVKKIRI